MTSIRSRYLALAAILFTQPALPASACPQQHPAVAVMASWKVACAHPLCGSLYATDPKSSWRQPGFAAGACGSDAGIVSAIGTHDVKGRIVLLGEVHDNRDHHQLRASLIDAPAIVMEQLRADQQESVVRFQASREKEDGRAALENFKREVGWDTSGWNKYPYDTLLQAIVASKRPLLAADPPRDTIRKIAKEGLGLLPEGERERLLLNEPLPALLQDALMSELEASHCGVMPKSAFATLADAQRYRDAHQARAVLDAAEVHGAAVLIAGNGHVRKDRGVPWYLALMAPGQAVISVQLIEVEDGKTDPEAYVERGPDGAPVADVLVFTPRAERPDPCLAFKDKIPHKPQ